jgi:hypothetical protein
MRARQSRGFSLISFALCVLKNRFYGSLSAPSAPFKRLLRALFSTARVQVRLQFLQTGISPPHSLSAALFMRASEFASALSVIFIIENGQKKS